MPLASHVLGDRVRASYLGLLIGDALSMPVHWYYNPSHITRDFGRITAFQAPKAAHPSSIMTLSNTGGAGRGAQTGSIIGDVINHGKKQFWGVPNMHYHQGMAAGENTLNAVVARLLVRTLTGLPRAADAAAAAAAAGAAAAPAAPAAALATAPYSTAPFLSAYVAFMTTPGSHNDTYAETCHRMFFKNLREGRAPEACADDDKHNVDSAGGLVLLPPPALLAAAAAAARSSGGSAAEAEAAAKAAARAAATAQMYATHKSQRLAGFVGVYADALAGALTSQLPPGEALRQATQAAGKALGLDIAKLVRDTPGQGQDTSVVGGTFTSACYIEGSLPSLLYLAHKYADSPREALIANTNVGGENCHRGAALGALLGAAWGSEAWPREWVRGLADAKTIAYEADALAAAATALATPIGAGAGAGAGAGGGGSAAEM